MLGFALIGVMLSTVVSQDLIGVSYTFDVDFEKTFNNKTCAVDENWVLTDYSSLKITSPFQKSQRGIRSRRESCMSSFSMVFLRNSILELNVFLEAFGEDSGLTATVFDESSVPIISYSYNRTSIGYKPGWTTLSIAINTSVTGYINLVGRSRNKEIVLVDSFRYITSHIKSDALKFFEVDESDALIENIHELSDLLFNDEGSGDFGSGEEEFDVHFEEDFDEEDIDEKGIIKIEE
ncbi:unnamed protein product, partial [Iphiclides podalirius]